MKGSLEYVDLDCQAPKNFDGTCLAHPPDDQFYASQHLFHCPARKTTEITITKQTFAVS